MQTIATISLGKIAQCKYVVVPNIPSHISFVLLHSKHCISKLQLRALERYVNATAITVATHSAVQRYHTLNAVTKYAT